LTDSKTVLDFWFVELQPKQRWIKDQKLDDEIKTRFEKTLYQARACELFEWRKNPKGRLAEIIVLDPILPRTSIGVSRNPSSQTHKS